MIRRRSMRHGFLRLVVLTLTMGLVPFALFAAGQGEAASAEGGELEPYEVRWIVVGNGEPRDMEMIEAAADEYMADIINATLKLEIYDWGSYVEKRDLAIAAGEVVDIAFSATWNGHLSNVAKGMYVDITDLAPEYAPGTIDQLPEPLLQGGMYNGRLFAIPANKEAFSANSVAFRTDILEKHGLTLEGVNGFQDITPLYEVVNENEPGMFMMIEPHVAMVSFENDAIGAGFEVVEDDDGELKVMLSIERPEYVKGAEMLYEWAQAGFISPDQMLITRNDEVARAKAGRVFSLMTNYKPNVESEWENTYGYEFEAVLTRDYYMNSSSVSNSMQAIPFTSDNAERALMFLELFNTDKYMNNLINFGIEDVHYVKVGENTIDFPEGVSRETSTYFPDTQWMFGNQMLNYLRVGQDPMIYENYRRINEIAEPTVSLGFFPDFAPVRNQIAALANIGKEYAPLMETGARDPDELIPEWLEKARSAGLEEVKTELQRQLDEWVEATGR
jgi:putative aldouronate transport system substrate-binding protein